LPAIQKFRSDPGNSSCSDPSAFGVEQLKSDPKTHRFDQDPIRFDQEMAGFDPEFAFLIPRMR